MSKTGIALGIVWGVVCGLLGVMYHEQTVFFALSCLGGFLIGFFHI